MIAAGCGGPQPGPAREAGPRVVDYRKGVRIDYRVPQVEVECEVILREGPLELFAYCKAPTPKEHESILKTPAPASSIYEALGLIGLVPGQTVKYDPETQTARPAKGDPVEVRVRYLKGGQPVEESACDWMQDVRGRRRMPRTTWLFTGSEKNGDGRFAADIEGTLVTVVDFPSSVLSLATSHSSSDEQLWLAAHTPAIPEIGTKVVLLLRPAAGAGK
jgi:hypothetical protein